MARSHSIYIVRSEDRIIAAFTVKHEMEAFVQRWIKPAPQHISVTRCRDNQPSTPCVSL